MLPRLSSARGLTPAPPPPAPTIQPCLSSTDILSSTNPRTSYPPTTPCNGYLIIEFSGSPVLLCAVTFPHQHSMAPPSHHTLAFTIWKNLVEALMGMHKRRPNFC